MASNKGKPTGRVAESKSDAGIKSRIEGRSPTPGAHGEGKRTPPPENPGGVAPEDQQAGGREHRGGDPKEDRNP